MTDVELLVIQDVLHFVTKFKLLDCIQEIDDYVLEEVYEKSEKILTKIEMELI